MEPILSVGITSYKRVKELVRCIKSINTLYDNEIEILISEDHSPLSKEIEQAVNELKHNSKYNIRFTSNETNLGYDMNLGSIIQKCSGKYILLMSDDDTIYENCLDEIIPFLKNDAANYGVLYAPFVYESTGKKDRYRGNNIEIKPEENNVKKYIYDSILFSGLIFRKDYVKDIDASRFKNHNYFQVYLFCRMIYEYGGYYFKKPSVLCVSDGENAYGISESSGGNALLANRKSVKSNLEFNKTLIKTIKTFDEDMGTNVFSSFEKQYSLHSYSGLSRARKEGVTYFNEYWKMLNELDIHLYSITKCYYILLLILGANISDKLLSGFRKMLKKES